jgi:hypothetical protein
LFCTPEPKKEYFEPQSPLLTGLGLFEEEQYRESPSDAAIDGLKELSNAVNVLTFQMRNRGVGIFKDWFLETTLQLSPVQCN